jgi:CRISPR-associated protein Cas5t
LREIKVLRISFTAPSAHFRIIQSKNPHRTYPLPPYSTVIGILANIIGCPEKIQEMLRHPFALGILCSYGYITREYTWLRNLSSKSHKKRYARTDLREWQGMVDHPGGQSPVVVEVLNDVTLTVYIHHFQQDIFSTLLTNIDQSENWLNHIHLGRSEDWAIPQEAKMVELNVSSRPYDLSGAEGYYQWMPDPKYCFSQESIMDDYNLLYKKMQGSVCLVTSIYFLREINNHNDTGKATVIRDFSHIPARVVNSQVPFLEELSLPQLLCDPELHVPVYLTLIDPNIWGRSE